MAYQRTLIQGGPSKFDLMLGLFGDSWNRFLAFTVVEGLMTPDGLCPGNKGRIQVVIDTVGRHEHASESWSFKGVTEVLGIRYCGYLVEGVFSTKDRRGWMRVTY